MSLSYPYPGCIIEFLEDNSPKIAMVLEDAGGKLRLLLPGRKEVKLAANRALPWIGPSYPTSLGKEEVIKLLEQHQAAREQKSSQIPVMDLWELSQGEIEKAPVNWFAELIETGPDVDSLAAYGRALLDCKTHFRFQPPEFQVYDAETVEKRLAEQKARAEREAIATQGAAFLRLLWDVANKKRSLPDNADAFPDKELADRIRRILFCRVANPESDEDESLWRSLSKGLPETPHLPLQLLMAWGLLPPHYNFWLDRADYASGDAWWQDEALEVKGLAAAGVDGLQACAMPFISIDGPTTIDIDDAFYLERAGDGFSLTIALAAPGLAWPFGSSLDKLVQHRATSIYLPEGDLHMLPECLGTDAWSLLAGKERPAFCLRINLNDEGEYSSIEPFVGRVNLSANLRYEDVQAVLDQGVDAKNPAQGHIDQLHLAHELALKRESQRVKQGAVVMLREEPEISLRQGPEDIEVLLEREKPCRDAQRLVSEMMILASGALADWANEREIPLLHRTQNVTIPHEYAGVWSKPEDLARIMRALIPSSLEAQARSHAALGLSRYAQVTSPLRRYPDLINEAQVIHFLQSGSPKWSKEDLNNILDVISPVLEGANHAQRYRPRYWKLLYFRQKGDKVWYEGVITEENEAFVTVALPGENIQVRGRRNMFGDRVHPGTRVRLRLGKINPLLNEVQILEAAPEE